MKARYKYITMVLCLIMVVACETPENPVYDSSNPDPNPPGTPAATVTGVIPAAALPGKTVSVMGSGFNTNPSANLVSFGPNAATVTSATTTQLDVTVPLASGAVDVKVGVRGSVNWSNEVPFVIESFIPDIANPVVETIDEEIVWPMGVAVDASGNVYVGSANDEVIYQITPAGEKSEFASVPVVGHIHFGPEGYLYVSEKWEGKIVRISPDGTTIEDVAEVSDAGDFDWDENGNMWILSIDYGVFVMSPGGSPTEVLGDMGSVKNLRVFDGYLYVSNIWDQILTRHEINGTSLGEAEEYLSIDDSGPSSFDFDENGVMYYAYAWETSLYVYAPGGAEEALFYEEELETPMRYMYYHGDKIYIVFPGWADVGKVISVYIGVNQAPRYGMQ